MISAISGRLPPNHGFPQGAIDIQIGHINVNYPPIPSEKTRSHNKTFLIRKITKALQTVSDGSDEMVTNPGASTATEPVDVVSTATATIAVAENLTKLDVPQLQARYLEVVGRSTSSSNKAYLVWKLREAQKGRIPIGPRKSTQRDDVTFKILPLRMEATIVDKLDEAWKRHGLHSRMDLFRKSLHDYLAGAGETEVAALLADAASEKQ